MLDGLELFGMGFSQRGSAIHLFTFDPSSYRTATRSRSLVQSSLRFHIGLEDVDDLRADLAAGFQRLAASG